jgi:hypothetical protein
MNKLTFLLLIFLAMACDKRTQQITLTANDGKDGTSCLVTSAPGGAYVTCTGSDPVFLANGAQGPAGMPGVNGRDGLNGKDGENALLSGLSCNVHDLRSWDGITDIKLILASNPPAGNFVLSNLSVGDSPSSQGFPGMPSALQNTVGLTGYALDCYAYLNIQTTGMHVFKVLSDDGVRLVINEQVLINNPGLHAPTTNASAAVELHRGPNKINVVYYQGPATKIALQLKMSGPNFVEQVIPSTLYRH